MLAQEENDLITRVGPDTPLNAVMRSYWMPTLLSREIPKPDCPPVRVRVLGEDLVAFRDSKGRVGLLGEHCPHRGTSLFFGRNEECGLRCIYHGWKIDVDGKVLDTPAEPEGSILKDKVRHTAYPCHEAAGIIFAYMGPKDRVPLFPNYDWTAAPLDDSTSQNHGKTAIIYKVSRASAIRLISHTCIAPSAMKHAAAAIRTCTAEMAHPN